MAHRARRYIAVAIIRGMLEDKPGGAGRDAQPQGGRNSEPGPGKP